MSRGTATLRAALVTIAAAAPRAGVAAEYVPPPIMPIPTAWQGRSTAVVRVLDKLDAHVETLTLKAGETGSYKSLNVTVRSCMDRPDGLPGDSGAFLDIQDRHGDVQPFNGWTFSREPGIGVFESPIYGVQLAGCEGDLVAPMAPPLPSPIPPPAAPVPDDAASAPDAAGSSVEVDQGAPPPQSSPLAGPDPGASPPAAVQGGDPAQPDPVYPLGAPLPPQSSAPPP